ncbi:hypothetical protein [Thermococcus sp.]|uniref:hypothetical protein n=1 Tax=Thermococcus sp. TaxID=35749 RepID=UPI002631BBC6|nr:hypothetical protein [Thermococcus sp.]MCD6143126.1 hypothetical protein [Thermococcus sp.]
MTETTLFKIVAIVCIAVLEICNIIFLRANGIIFSVVIATITGIAGYQIGVKVQKNNKK